MNLGFDSETREPTIYAREAPYTSVVGTIPWKREADTMTILTQPSHFSEQAIAAAQKRYDDFRNAEKLTEAALESEIRTTEADLISAWRSYHAADPADRPALRRPILTAERTMREKEAQRAPLREYRPFREGVGIYVEPLPLDRRAISLTAVGTS